MAYAATSVAGVRPRLPLLIGLGATTTLAAVFAYSRFVLPWQTRRIADLRKANGDYHVMVDRSGGGI